MPSLSFEDRKFVATIRVYAERPFLAINLVFLLMKSKIGALLVACPVWTCRLAIERALKSQYMSIKDTPKRGI